MVLARRVFAFSIVLLGLATNERFARAGDSDSCLTAAEQGQRARKQSKLKDAHEQFQICAHRDCPQIVQRDCAQWLIEVGDVLPTVTVAVDDEDGKELVDVKVSVDGKPFLSRLDGKTQPIDPGVHVFRFESAGKVTFEEKVLVNEGEKTKRVSAKFPKKDDVTIKAHGKSIAPLIVVGVGGVLTIVGGVLFVKGLSDFPNECTLFEDRSCLGHPEKVSDAEGADSLVRFGIIAGASGLLVTGGGLAWYFLSKDQPAQKQGQIRATPLLSPQSVGLKVTF